MAGQARFEARSMGKRKAAQDTGEGLRTVLREETTNLPLQQQERVLRRMGGQGFQHSLKGRYGLPDEMIQRIHLQGSKDGSTMSFPILALDKWIQDACQRCPDWANLLTTAACESNDQGGLQAVLYTDEAVPGNVIRADNARRSYLWYISWSNLGKALRSECSWAIVFVLRATKVKEVRGGLAGVTRAILAHLETCFEGFAVQDSKQQSHLIRTKCCYLLADEAALKGAVGAKGSSGFRPCILCENALDKNRAQIDGHETIACHDFRKFRPIKQAQLDVYMAHLAALPNKSQLEKAQTLLGWRWVPESIVCQPGSLIAERCIYDSMHCYWSQGVVNCEIGLFWLAAKRIGFDLAELSQLADLPWRSHTGGTSAAELVSDRLLQPGVDFKGDAKQTLLCLPLLNYCGQVLLAGKLRDEVECLNRLNRVCRQILTLKSNTKCITQAHVDTLLRLQEQHLQAFKACYGTSQVKPKHHYGFHTSQPAIRLQVFVDCFVCERKNKNFKTQLRGKDCPRQDFETTALASLLSKDRQWTVNWSSRAVLSGPKVQHQGETLRAHAQCQGENFPSGLYILSERLAVHVLGFLMRADGPLAVAARMCCSSWRIDCSTWTKQSQECLVSLTDLSWALRPAWTLEDGMKVILLH